eukprot:scaffold11544_cov101-Skeletonema_dohrnii-CCMP3373.AAC.5
MTSSLLASFSVSVCPPESYSCSVWYPGPGPGPRVIRASHTWKNCQRCDCYRQAASAPAQVDSPFEFEVNFVLNLK